MACSHFPLRGVGARKIRVPAELLGYNEKLSAIASTFLRWKTNSQQLPHTNLGPYKSLALKRKGSLQGES